MRLLLVGVCNTVVRKNKDSLVIWKDICNLFCSEVCPIFILSCQCNFQSQIWSSNQVFKTGKKKIFFPLYLSEWESQPSHSCCYGGATLVSSKYLLIHCRRMNKLISLSLNQWKDDYASCIENIYFVNFMNAENTLIYLC